MSFSFGVRSDRPGAVARAYRFIVSYQCGGGRFVLIDRLHAAWCLGFLHLSLTQIREGATCACLRRRLYYAEDLHKQYRRWFY